MRRKIFYPLVAFVALFVIHAIYTIWQGLQISKQWVQLENTNMILLYFKHQDYLMGLAYALAGAFTIYALLKFLQHSKKGVAGVVGGITLTGILYIAGCFLLGCCGSPMLAVYLSLFGSSFLEFTKPLVLILTTTSVVIGYFWINKKTKTSQSCCIEDDKPKGENLTC